MSPLQKNSDGIRRSGSAGPIRLSPKGASTERSAAEVDASLSAGRQRNTVPEQETEMHWEEEGRAEVLHETRSPVMPRNAPNREEPVLHPRPVFRASRRRPSWGRIGAYAGIGAVAAAFLLLSTVFARLTVAVRPRVEESAIAQVNILFDASVARALLPQRVVPAEKLSFSRTATREFPATGTGRVEERSRGRALIYNAFNTSPQLLVAGTRFTTDTGAVYRIQKAVTVPAAKMEQGKISPRSAEAELVADAAGDAGNRSGSITLRIPGFRGTPRYEGFYAVASQGFSGGFAGESALITRGDLAAAEEAVSKEAFGGLEAEMGRKLPAELLMLKALREVEIARMTSPAVGSRAAGGKFAVSAEARGTVLAFREQDMVSLLTHATLTGRDDQEFIPGSARLSYTVRAADFEKGTAEVSVSGDLKTRAKISERELAGLAAGKKRGSLTELFRARAELASFRMSLFPPWRATAPRDPEKIRFVVENP